MNHGISTWQGPHQVARSEQHHFALETRQSDFRAIGIEECEIRSGLAIVIFQEDDLGDSIASSFMSPVSCTV